MHNHVIMFILYHYHHFICIYSFYMNYDIINYGMETSVCGDDKNMMKHSYSYSNNDIN